jgi:hypothetical protein
MLPNKKRENDTENKLKILLYSMGTKFSVKLSSGKLWEKIKMMMANVKYKKNLPCFRVFTYPAKTTKANIKIKELLMPPL